MEYSGYDVNTPQWGEVTVGSHLPAELRKLAEIAHNLWWAWSDDAKRLYCDLDSELWKKVRQNPVSFLERINYEKPAALAHDKNFVYKMDAIYSAFKKYVDVGPDHRCPSIAHFSMEYGLDEVLKICSGGLGVLAGDYLKEMLDSNVDLCAIGLLYRYGYFDQSLSIDSQQAVNYKAQNFEQLPIEKVMQPDGKRLMIHISYADSFVVHANVWKANVRRIPLYLLDTNNKLNSEFDRPIAHHPYGGDWRNRLKQEILLGIDGMITLRALGITKDVYHCNEGHAALINTQRLCGYINGGLNFRQAMELIRTPSLYAVHIPVSAGHDYFGEGLFDKYMKGYPGKLGITWDNPMDLGRHNPGDREEHFCISVFACKTYQEVDGINKLHKSVSQQMFAPIWKRYFPGESHVGCVTSGIHLPTWCAAEWGRLFRDNFDENFFCDQSNQKIWETVYGTPDGEIWNTRLKQKAKLLGYIKSKYSKDWLRSQIDPALSVSILKKFNPDTLLIGFGHRFATYKKTHLLFTDIDQLARIVSNPKYPVQLIFVGKAYPNDGAGQGLIKQIAEISQCPEFLGKIIFLENYDMDLACHLISGVDIWMNTPTRLIEALGTSGEKALMNGVLNFSVLDGWWCGRYHRNAGWALTDRRTYQNEQYQNRLDTRVTYYLLKHDVLPLYYEHGGKNYLEGWIEYIKNSIARIAPHFTVKRQLDDCYNRFYNKPSEHSHILAADNFMKARIMTNWRTNIRSRWDAMEIRSIETGNGLSATVEAGKEYGVTIIIDEKGLDDAVGIESVIIRHEDGQDHVYEVVPLLPVSKSGNLYTFKATSGIFNVGSFKQAFRMYLENALLPHRQDLCCVRWF